MITNPRIGMQAKFTGRDTVFHGDSREGKIAAIVADADLKTDGHNFGQVDGLPGTCLWGDMVDGVPRGFITSLSELEEV